MDKNTLYRLFYLPKQIEQKKREIQRIWDRLTSMSPNLSGMPHGSGVHDKVGDGVVELVTKKEELEAQMRGFEQEEKAINDWIDSVEDIQVNLILCLRFREKLTWNEVADQMGGINTDDSCRKMIDRYLEKGDKNGGTETERNG